jgi:hypothetical protein
MKNVSMFGATDSYGGGAGVLLLHNAATIPSSNPSAGHILYVENGALKGRGTSGTVTTIAPAEPHCPVCGADYMLEFDNEKYGYFAICVKCLANEIGQRGWIVRDKSRLRAE